MRRYVLSFLMLASCGGGAATGGAAPRAVEKTTTPSDADGVQDKEGGKKSEGAETMVDVPSAQAAFDDASKAFAASGSDCTSMCKALQSMARATTRLCELAGDSAIQCSDAKTKLEGARAKVKATCGGACE